MKKKHHQTDRIPQTLGDEEEAWYRHDSENESVLAIKIWLKQVQLQVHQPNSPLADEEDAWCRR